MDIVSVLSLTALFTSTVLLVAAAGYQRRNTRLLRIVNSHQVAANSHVQKSRMDLLEARNRARLLEDTVKNGTSAVERVHQAVTTTTFSLIDRFASSEEFRENARRARARHDKTSSQLYQSVHTTNKALHILADTLYFGKKEKRLTVRKKLKDRQ